MKKTLISCALALLASQAYSQVEDISITVSPTASYQWWDDNAAIEDGVFLGGRVGFGFGEYLELRGVYEQTLDLKNTIDEFGIEYDDLDFEERDVDVKRYGGELKANIPTGGDFAPYITLGSGIQEVEVKDQDEDFTNKQIYATAGLGAKINFGDRASFNIEAKNHAFNMNPASVLFVPSAENSDFEDAINGTKDTRMYNWSVLAGLQFYLGGREPGSLSDLDREYMRKFSGGLTGFKLVLEPGGAYMNWDNDVNLKDTYLLGGSAGIDLNQYVGLRGFYYQSTKDEEISTDWDELAMYGGDITAKLNVSRGLVPYISIGGGYLNVYDSYRGDDDLPSDDLSGYFAKGGVGVSIPFGANLEAFGAANMVYTTSKDEEDVISPDDLRDHTMYNVGLRLQLGGTPDIDEKVKERTSDRFDKEQSLYEERIDELEKELEKAYEENDSERAVRAIEEKRRLEEGHKNSSDDSKVVMTPEELQNLVTEVLEDVENEEGSSNNNNSNSNNNADQEELKQRINRLESLLLQVNTQNGEAVAVPQSSSDKILAELNRLNDKVDRNAMQLSQMNGNGDKTIIVEQDGTTTPVVTSENKAVSTADDALVDTDNDGDADGVSQGLVAYQGMSVFAGAAFGDESYGVFGVKGHYDFTNSNFMFVPDIYVGFGDDSGFGINANAHLNFAENATDYVKPYIGVGVGINKIEGDSKFNTNIILGTTIDVLDDNLYFDYTSRNLFDGNQINVGYRFSF